MNRYRIGINSVSHLQSRLKYYYKYLIFDRLIRHHFFLSKRGKSIKENINKAVDPCLPRTWVRAIDIGPHHHFSSLVFLGTVFKAGRALWCQLYCCRKSRLYEITSCKRDSVSLAPSTLMDGLRADDIRGFRHPLFKRGVDVVFLKRDLKGIEVFEVRTKFCLWDILCVMCVRRSKRINPNKS